jgi:hypothetical protein
MDVETVFCKADDFCKGYEKEIQKTQLKSSKVQRDRKTSMSLSEMITISLRFHSSCYRNFKGYYIKHVCQNLKGLFPNLVSYNRFIQLMPRVLSATLIFLKTLTGQSHGICFVDSTSINVCHNKRISRNRVFKGLATRGKTTMGWFFGFKLHLIVNDQGDILSWAITQGNVDDRKPVPFLAKRISGKLFGDKGYISKTLFETLFSTGVQLITSLRGGMKNKLMDFNDRLLLRKRFIIETINDQLKNISQIEHSRHRSPVNFLFNLVAALAAYQLQPKKPSLKFYSTPTFSI